MPSRPETTQNLDKMPKVRLLLLLLFFTEKSSLIPSLKDLSGKHMQDVGGEEQGS